MATWPSSTPRLKASRFCQIFGEVKVREAYQRTIGKRFQFAAWMFEQAGFSKEEAKARGRLMVTSLMGDSSTGLKAQGDWEKVIEREHAILVRK
ncbi:hypothetical protein CLV75_2862 [Ruegeria conchae]|uniref:Uncharacterized protein n=1 Tax=Ruegeria conchae TaxID=981384 RepID=A0A497Z516_9RHOB|nr:hypothetical protein CLV75_2862 [Ruegeria conchae]